MNVPGPTHAPPVRITPAALTGRAAEPSARRDAIAPAEEPAFEDILTTDERAFFDLRMALGPLTYGPARGAAPSEAAPLGHRIDRRA